MLAIDVKNLTKCYKTSLARRRVPSLDGLDLEVHQNEIFGFLGQNGAGKTTTIKLLCGLIKPTRGEAFVMGESVRRAATRKRIGYLPENPYFYEYLTPRETLDFYGRLHGLGVSERQAEWEKLSALLDLRDIAGQRVRTFSKGMRQRLGFAAALVGDPGVLILDEPMSGLDPMGRRMFRERILQLREQGKTIFFSSHVLGDVEQICDRVGILVKGRLKVQGRIDELLQGNILGVEVIVAGLAEQAAAALAPRARAVRRSEAGDHFVMPGLDAANELLQSALQQGGTLVEFTPVRQSLEDYFVNRQESGK